MLDVSYEIQIIADELQIKCDAATAQQRHGVTSHYCLQFVLVPAAYLLPRSWLLAVAKVLALLLALLPRPGMTSYWSVRHQSS